MNEMNRIPPSNIEAEACCIGAMILSPAAAMVIRDALSAIDFYRPAHSTLFDMLCGMVDARQPVDLVTINSELKRIGKSDEFEYVVSLAESVPDGANAEYYASLVRACSIKRQLIQLGNAIIQQAYEPASVAQELLEQYQKAIYDLDARLKPKAKTECHAHEAAHEVLTTAEARQTEGNAVATVTFETGFPVIDAAICGLRPGHLVTLGAKTSTGKSTFALNVTSNVASQGGACLYISAEMPTNELAQCLLQAGARVNGKLITNAQLNVDDWNRLSQYEGELRDRQIYLIGRAMSLPEIALKAREVAMHWGSPVNLIVVDYLQIMKLPKASEMRERVGLMTCGLKQLAMEMDATIIALSQFARMEKGSNRPPTMYDMKESGSIENDSNEVLLLHRPEPPELKFDTDGSQYIEVWAQVAKCRSGSVTPWPCDGDGQILKWSPSHTLFRG